MDASLNELIDALAKSGIYKTIVILDKGESATVLPRPGMAGRPRTEGGADPTSDEGPSDDGIRWTEVDGAKFMTTKELDDLLVATRAFEVQSRRPTQASVAVKGAVNGRNAESAEE